MYMERGLRKLFNFLLKNLMIFNRPLFYILIFLN